MTEQEKLREKYVSSAQVESQQEGALGPGAVLRKGAAIAVRVVPKRPCFAYLVRCTPSGKGELLAPPPGEQAPRVAPQAELRLPSAGWLQLVDRESRSGSAVIDDTHDLCLVLSKEPLHPTNWDFCVGDGREPDTKSNDTTRKGASFAEDARAAPAAAPPLRVLVVED